VQKSLRAVREQAQVRATASACGCPRSGSSGLPTNQLIAHVHGIGCHPSESETTLCRLARLLVEMQSVPPGASKRRASASNRSVSGHARSPCWRAPRRASRSRTADRRRGRPRAFRPHAQRAAAACSSTSSTPASRAAWRRAATPRGSSRRSFRGRADALPARSKHRQNGAPVLLLSRLKASPKYPTASILHRLSAYACTGPSRSGPREPLVQAPLAARIAASRYDEIERVVST
jgi:hypothetical protein